MHNSRQQSACFCSARGLLSSALGN